MNSNKHLSFIIITPAYNEEQHIEKTLNSMLFQTVLPMKWLIVSDGSTDRTDEIIAHFSSKYQWIEFLRLSEHKDRNFASKVNCFNAAFHIVKNLEYDIIGNLDADISFDNDYFEFLLNKFKGNPSLGVAGTPFIENSSQFYNYNFTNIEHVSGACQLFRKQCFEEIGGYVPIKSGGIDWIAVTTARMKGWKTQTFIEKTCVHHRPIGGSNNNVLKMKFRYGQKDYLLGGHPLWQLFRSVYQMKFKPYIIGGLLIFLGYAWSALIGDKRTINKELMTFNRSEQARRLKRFLSRLCVPKLTFKQTV